MEIKIFCYLDDIDFGECYSLLFRILLELLIKMMKALRGITLAVMISFIGITMAKELYGNQGNSR